jgi:hypothetical protein
MVPSAISFVFEDLLGIDLPMVYNLKNHLNTFHIAAIIANVMSHISKIEESA